MTEISRFLVRELNSREKRRYRVHGMIPVDALDPSILKQDIIEQHRTNFFYRYGTNLETDDKSAAVESRNVFSRIRGFKSSICNHHTQSLIFIYCLRFFSPVQNE